MATKAKRTHERQSVALRASVAAAGGIPTIDCLIRDASAGGCQIVSNEIAKLPDDVIVYPEGFGKPLTGRIVWRDRRSAGIQFVKPSWAR